MSRTTTFLVCLALGTSLVAQKAVIRDSILRKNGKLSTNIKLIKLELDKITYTKGGKETEVPVRRVTRFRLSNLPDAYTRGESAANRSDHVNAAKMFGEAAALAKRPVVKQSATFFAGRSFALAAEKDPSHANNAIAQLESYIGSAANGYYLPEAKVRLAKARLASGDEAGAEAMLATLEDEAVTGGWPRRWGAHIKFTKAQAQFAQRKFSAARASFASVDDAVGAALGEDNRNNAELNTLKTDALVMQGETYIGEKLYDDALRYYRGLAGSSGRGVKAAAEAGQGQILFIQGADPRDVQKLRQAQLALARAAIEPDTNDTTSAKYLYYMGKVLTALGDKEAKALGRAKNYFQSVKNYYGSTTWAKLARQELEG